jgi:TolB-like protein/Tfp pilus assembly protein PilF
MKIDNFFSELKRRNVIRMAGLYLVGAWLVTQVASTILPMFAAPEWLPRTIVVLLAIGFVPAVIFSWVFELTPQGLKREDDVAPEQSITPQTGRRMDRMIIAVLLLALSYFCVDKFVLAPGRSAAQPAPLPNESSIIASAKSIAVLPFDNLSRDPDNAYFAEGIQDEILTRLAKVADLKVISRTSTQKYKSAPDNLRAIAQQLGVTNILEGSAQKSNDQVRVNVQLINALTDSHLWADTFDRKLTDIFAVESDIAKTIAETLQVKLTGTERTALAARPTENSEAYELYLRGRYFLAKRSSDDLRQAINYFDEAITKDPNYAPAYAGLADGYALLLDYANVSWTDVLPKARAAAEKALALDDNLAEAHVSLGLILQQAEINPEKAEPEFRRAIALNPNYAAAHYFLALSVLSPRGQCDQAVAEMKRALELDPFSVVMNANLGFIYYLGRRYPEAIAQLHKTLELNPNFGYPHLLLGFALEASGNLTEAIKEYEKLYANEKGAEVKDRTFGVAILAHAYGRQGNRDKALHFFAQSRDPAALKGKISPYAFALACLGLGETDEALAALERSYEARESVAISSIRVDPLLDPLRSDPRFEALAEKIVPARVFAKPASPAK